jgi:prepilin-type N-terminal cleavage/methylation domain-containing protein
MRRVRWPRARAFTLIELLVAIAIIVILIAVVLPALRQTRFSARSTLCLSNHRQLVVAWSVYANDHGVFPYGDAATSYKTNEDWGWGGVDWYPSPAPAPNNIPRTRPVNSYLGGDGRITTKTEVFVCPLDIGTHEFGTGIDNLAIQAASSLCDKPDTVFGTAGTSYRANTWIYCKPGAANGWGGFPSFPNYRSKQSPADVMVSPSRFVLLQDSGPANWAVTQPSQIAPASSGEWWHGNNQAVMSFLDGSARQGKAGLLVCDWYSMHMMPIPSPNSTWRWPGRP